MLVCVKADLELALADAARVEGELVRRGARDAHRGPDAAMTIHRRRILNRRRGRESTRPPRPGLLGGTADIQLSVGQLTARRSA